KIFAGQESHGAPPGYYFALFWVSFWPGATLAALATPAVWQARREAAVKFLLAWLVPSWLVLELVVTKLPHYVLPLYPPIAILIAIAIFGLVVPSLGQLFPSPTLARILRESGCTQPQAAAVGYQEPSVVFLAGTATRLVDVAGAAEFLRGGECRFVFIEASQ